jgi:trehalose synthase-fused probable maltokinase
VTLDIARLDLLVGQIPHEVLAAQRWFRAKGRPIADLALEEAAPLVADPDLRDAALVVIRVSFDDDGADELYLLPMLSEPDAGGPSPAEAWGIVAVRDAETGTVLREPRDGDGVWRRLHAALAAEMTLPGLHGSFVFHALTPLGPPGDERRLAGEQSNTSVALGEAWLLKLYRRMEPGENPDLELPRFLTQAGFERVPAVAGYVRYVPARGDASVVAMLQAYLPDAVDAWRWLLNELVAGRSALPELGRLGDVTARMHVALASRPDDPAFLARTATHEDLAAWRASAEGQLAQAAAVAPQAVGHATAVRRAFDAIDEARDARVSRIHGDYHLGQVLRSGDDFWVIDFEGEPARPLGARRQPNSPLRDVAGMLRSFDYAARSVERERGASAFDAEGWLEAAREAFLRAYRAGGMPLDDGLLGAFELEKACYEVQYEARFRPDWAWLPIQALQRLARA